jgi:hypothetical protein
MESYGSNNLTLPKPYNLSATTTTSKSLKFFKNGLKVSSFRTSVLSTISKAINPVPFYTGPQYH